MFNVTKASIATRLAAGLLLLAGLAGCGGGWYLGTDFEIDDDDPQVTLVASQDSADPGETIRLAAAAVDDGRVERVEFFRILDGDTESLGTDASAPFEINTTIPSDAEGEIRFFARARDDDDNVTDSDDITVTVNGP